MFCWGEAWNPPFGKKKRAAVFLKGELGFGQSNFLHALGALAFARVLHLWGKVVEKAESIERSGF